MYLGSWKLDDLLTFAVNTHTPSTGAATDADSVPSYRVYEDETGTAILTGSMAKLDDANTTGFYSEQITLSAANGFEKGKCYTIHVSAAVGGVTSTMHHAFQIEAEVDANQVSNLGANVITAAAIAADAVTEIQSGLATAANQTTIMNRLGAFTGSGINTVLGFFQALLKKDATAPTDVGGTYSPATDSLEALRDFLTTELDELAGSELTIISVVAGNRITVYAADTWGAFTLSGLGDLTPYETIAFIAKKEQADSDANAIWHVRSGTGLVRINKVAPASSANGSLTVGVGAVTIKTAMLETAGVPGYGACTWWIKGFDTSADPDEGKTIATGEFVVNGAGHAAII